MTEDVCGNCTTVLAAVCKDVLFPPNRSPEILFTSRLSPASFTLSHDIQHQVYVSTLDVLLWQGYSRLQTCHLSCISLCCVREDRCWVAGGAKHAYNDSGLTVKPYMVNKHAHRENMPGVAMHTPLHRGRDVHATIPQMVRDTCKA